MIRGTVIGQVWATRKARGLDGPDAAAGGRARRRGTDDRAAGGRERHAGRARGRGRDGGVRLGRAQRAAPRPRQPRSAVRRGDRRHRGRSGLMFLGRVGGNRLVDGEVAAGAGPQAAAGAPVSAGRSAARRRGGGGRRRRRRRSRPTIWWCAPTSLDAGTGDDVIVAFGHAARVALSEKLPPGSKPIGPDRRGGGGGRRSGGDPAVKDADLRRLVAEVTREVTAQAERGARPAAGGGRCAAGRPRRGHHHRQEPARHRGQDRPGDRRRGRRHRRHLADAGLGLFHDDHHRRHRRAVGVVRRVQDPARAYGGRRGRRVPGHARGRRQRIATDLAATTLQRVVHRAKCRGRSWAVASSFHEIPAHGEDRERRDGGGVPRRRRRAGRGSSAPFVVKRIHPRLSGRAGVRPHVRGRGEDLGAAHPSEHRPGVRVRLPGWAATTW